MANLTTGKIVKKLDLRKYNYKYLLRQGEYFKLRDGKTFLSISGGYDSKNFAMFRFDEDFLSEFVVDPSGIRDFIIVDDETIVTCSNESVGIIKVWKY